MGDERQRILDMVENGAITAQEAVELLKAMEKRPDDSIGDIGGRSEYREKYGKSKLGPDDLIRKFAKEFSRDFSKDFRRDYSSEFNQFGEKMMRFMQESVGKLKTMDFDLPLGESVTFSQTFTETVPEAEEIIADLANGQLEIYPISGDEVRAECTVKAYRTDSEVKAREEFFSKFVFVADGKKIRLISDQKSVQVNIVLYVPEKDFERVTARLFNGSFTMKRISASTVYVKTANGKIELRDGRIDEAELETANGAIQVQEIRGGNLEAETYNGRIYVDGELESAEAKSLNGNVAVTLRGDRTRKVEAKTVAGNVEIYVPRELPIKGEISSNLGRMDVHLEDAERVHEQDQFLQKTMKFTKNTSDPNKVPLILYGEAKTGSVLVRYFTGE